MEVLLTEMKKMKSRGRKNQCSIMKFLLDIQIDMLSRQLNITITEKVKYEDKMKKSLNLNPR